MHLSDFFFMLYGVISRIILLAPSIDFLLKIKGDKLVYLYRGLSLITQPQIECSIVHVEHRDLDKEMHISFKLNLTLRRNTEHQLTEFVKDLMHGRIVQDAASEQLPVLPNVCGLLDPSVMQEVQKYHPVNLLRNRSESVRDAEALVGVCLCKSERIWKNGQVHALCGISASSNAEACDVLLYDHYGILDNGTESVLAAFQKGKTQVMAMLLNYTNSAMEQLWFGDQGGEKDEISNWRRPKCASRNTSSLIVVQMF